MKLYFVIQLYNSKNNIMRDLKFVLIQKQLHTDKLKFEKVPDYF